MSDIKGIWFQLGEKRNSNWPRRSSSAITEPAITEMQEVVAPPRHLHMRCMGCPELTGEVGSLERYLHVAVHRYPVELTAHLSIGAYETGVSNSLGQGWIVDSRNLALGTPRSMTLKKLKSALKWGWDALIQVSTD